MPLLFVARIVTPRSVRAGHLERQLLLEEVVSRQLQPGDADEDDAAARAAHLRRLPHRFVAARRRGHEDAVHAAAAREAFGDDEWILAGVEVNDFGARAPGQLEPRGIRIDAEHPAPVGPEQPHGQLTDQTEAGDDDRLAHGRLQEANALQRDRADHRERRLLVADVVRDARAQS